VFSGNNPEAAMFFSDRRKTEMVSEQDALPGRREALATAQVHFISGIPLKSEVPDGMQQAMFGMGCFWGIERIFWRIPGVWLTMVGYAAGFTPNPTYKETCTQLTGHNEVVRVIFDPNVISYAQLLKVFWENHNPTQGMRQGNDVGSTYRSGIYTYDADQMEAAQASKQIYADKLSRAGFGAVTTEVLAAPVFYFGEEYHQQYLEKNPNGYCGVAGTGVTCPIGLNLAT
jgi:peptide-methionine (S)-S-oxide reductase